MAVPKWTKDVIFKSQKALIFNKETRQMDGKNGRTPTRKWKGHWDLLGLLLLKSYRDVESDFLELRSEVHVWSDANIVLVGVVFSGTSSERDKRRTAVEVKEARNKERRKGILQSI